MNDQHKINKIAARLLRLKKKKGCTAIQNKRLEELVAAENETKSAK